MARETNQSSREGQRKLTVLVTGATGNQGGALTRALLRRGHRVRALTRRPDSPAAVELKQLGAEIVSGDFDDSNSLAQAAKDVDTVFALSTPFEAGVDAETRQGINIADAAKAAGAKHLKRLPVPDAPHGDWDARIASGHFDEKVVVLRAERKFPRPMATLGAVDGLNGGAVI